MSLIFGYEFVDGKATTNGYKFINRKSPPNLGIYGYERPDKITDADLHDIPDDCVVYHNHHYHTLVNFFDIEIKPVEEIETKYYYPIDVFIAEFWNNPESREFTNISEKAMSDIKSGKAKILVLYCLESFQEY